MTTSNERTRAALASRPARKIASGGTIAIACLVSVAPLYYIVRTSFRTANGYLTGRQDFSLEGWRTIFSATGLPRQLLNSAIVTGLAIAIILAVSGFAGYGFSRLLRGRTATAAFLVIVIAFMIPVQSIVAAMFFQSVDLGMTDSYFGVALIYAALGIPLTTFLLTAAFRAIPNEVFEAALIDGAGYVSIALRIVFPMSRATFVTAALLQFVFIWNDLLIALLWLPQSNLRTLTVGLATVTYVSGAQLVSVPTLMAGSILQATPVVILFVGLQKYVVRGLTAGAVG